MLDPSTDENLLLQSPLYLYFLPSSSWQCAESGEKGRAVYHTL